MKLFITADIEGCADVVAWSETERGSDEYLEASTTLSREVAACCQAAIDLGVKDIYVKDAHDLGRNIQHRRLPEGVVLGRQWSGHPYAMLEDLDESFDAVMMIGFHSAASDGGSPLSHTMSLKIDRVTLNGERVDEFSLHSDLAASIGVPVILVTGDDALCQRAALRMPDLVTCPVKSGIGDAVWSLHPADAEARIYEATQQAIKRFQTTPISCPQLPSHFYVEVRYHRHQDAYRLSHYPGCKRIDSQTLGLDTQDYYEVMRFAHFVM